MKISDNIRKLRLARGLSQEALGERLGVSGQAVSKWEQGANAPDISILPEIADIFGVTVDSLLSDGESRRHAGYGNYRNELMAIYENEDGEENFRRAAEAYGEVILNGQPATQDFVFYGLLYAIRARRDAEIAERYYHKAIEFGNDSRDTRWIQAHQQLTTLLWQHGRAEEALREHQRWLDAEPDEPAAHVAVCYALECLGRYEESYAQVKKALALRENDAHVQTMAGDICMRTGRHDEAFEHWDRAFEADDSSISCLFSKAEAYAQLGRNDEAIAQFREIIDWLDLHGYGLSSEKDYPLRRIRELQPE